MNSQFKIRHEQVSTYKRSFNRATLIEIIQAVSVLIFLLGALALESFITRGTV